MAYKNGNYTAFYVDEPFYESNLGANSAKDFVTYNLLKNYNVRDGSDWEATLKPRLHDRLNNSKNIVLILSSITKNSRALREEIDFGINKKGLPVIVIYPEYKNEESIINCSTKTIK